MGRPLGAPNDPAFQTRVLEAALKLLEAKDGPVLEDFDEDAPVSDARETALVCPVNLYQEVKDLTETSILLSAFREEITGMRPWYDMSVEKRGRTTVGISGLEMDGIIGLLSSFTDGTIPENPRADISLADTLNLAVDDLKAYYFEAMTVQPGQESIDSLRLVDWFFQETVAGKVIKAVKDTCKKSEDGMLQVAGKILLVPTSQRRHRAG